MLASTDLKKVFHKLVRQFSTKIHFLGSDITVKFCNHASKVQLSTPVYLGSNYIPKSVRACIRERAPFPAAMPTKLSVDEDNFRVMLNYCGFIDRTDECSFESLVEEFGYLAEGWRCLLDEKDKNDLVYIHAS